MKEIPLTHGKVALVDDEDYPELSKFKWYAHKMGTKISNKWYATRAPTCGIGRQLTLRMHTVILGTQQGLEIDHINGNGLDNRRENLRAVTRRENCQNLHIPKTSKFPGVDWNKYHRKWRATIRFAGKKRFLGYYDSEEAAARRYRIACDWQLMETEVFV